MTQEHSRKKKEKKTYFEISELIKRDMFLSWPIRLLRSLNASSSWATRKRSALLFSEQCDGISKNTIQRCKKDELKPHCDMFRGIGNMW